MFFAVTDDFELSSKEITKVMTDCNQSLSIYKATI